MRILIIEDDKGIRNALELLLEFEGYPAESVEKGEDALELLKGSEYGLILLDLNTKGISPQEFMRGLPKLSRPPVGVLSASDRIELEATQLAADFFIRKPFDSEQLLAQVARFAQLQGQPAEPRGPEPVILH